MSKKTFFAPLPFVAMILMLSNCATVQYTSRQVDVNRSNIASEQQVARLEVDWSHQVTATSDFQSTRREAAKEAEFLCLQNEKIDVVVDPIFKFQYEPLRTSGQWKATVIGYAGKYKDTVKTAIDAAKKYNMEDIEKYKMLTDPNFPQYYYRSRGYVCHSDAFLISTNDAGSGSVMLQQTDRERNMRKVKTFDYDKAKKLRNAGIATTSVGATLLLLGIPHLVCWPWNGGTTYPGITMVTVGSATALTGIPMWCVGSYRKRHSTEDIDLSLGVNAQGMGVKFTF